MAAFVAALGVGFVAALAAAFVAALAAAFVAALGAACLLQRHRKLPTSTFKCLVKLIDVSQPMILS